MRPVTACLACGSDRLRPESPHVPTYRSSGLGVSRSGDRRDRRFDPPRPVTALECLDCGFLHLYAAPDD